jgi:hypothetical protein
MKTLICDLNVYDNGHHIAFVNAILKYSKGREDIIFLFNQQAAYFCKGMNEDPRIFFLDEALLHPTGRPLLNKFREYRLIEKFALDHAIQRVIFLEIDQYQLAIGLSKPPFLITGIYFRPFHLIPTNGGSMIYHLKKRLLFRVLHLNRKVEPLFLLNDLAASTRYPSWFRYLPDPIFAGAAGGTDGIRSRHNISPSTHLFLAFGAMGYRKNIRNTLEAYLLATFENDTAVLIAGKVRKDYREEFDAAVGHFLASNTDKRKRLVVCDEYVPEEQLDAYFEEADTILLCYVKFYGSSGLMGKAAQHQKTCIVPDQGLLAGLNEEYEIGYSADPADIQSIASALSRAEQEPLPGAGFQRFVRDHHESAFLNTLLTA